MRGVESEREEEEEKDWGSDVLEESSGSSCVGSCFWGDWVG